MSNQEVHVRKYQNNTGIVAVLNRETNKYQEIKHSFIVLNLEIRDVRSTFHLPEVDPSTRNSQDKELVSISCIFLHL